MIIHKAFFAIANNIYGEWRGSIVGSQMCTFKCQNESDIQLAAHDALKYFLDNGTNNYRDKVINMESSRPPVEEWTRQLSVKGCWVAVQCMIDIEVEE